MSKHVLASGRHGGLSLLGRYGRKIVGAVALYVLLIAVMASPLLELLYKQVYQGRELLVWLFGVYNFFLIRTQLVEIGLKALGESKNVFRGWGMALATSAVLFLPLTFFFSVYGVAIAFCVNAITANIFFAKRLSR